MTCGQVCSFKTTCSSCHTGVIVLMITFGQVCSCGNPLPDCGENPGDGGPVSDGRSSGPLHHYCHCGLAHPCHPRPAHHLLPDHTQKPLCVHWRSPAGPHHCTGHLLQVNSTSVQLHTLHLHTCTPVHTRSYTLHTYTPTSLNNYTPAFIYTLTSFSCIFIYSMCAHSHTFTFSHVHSHHTVLYSIYMTHTLVQFTLLLLYICTS